jgi:glycosyltransferase involved in cell wall biosynthesis
MTRDPESAFSSPHSAQLIVFADDWGRHPSSCQHLVARFLERRRIVWVNTIGMRPPRFDWLTFKRGLQKARQWLGSSRKPSSSALSIDGNKPAANPLVLNPKMWPSFRSRFARSLNRRLLERTIKPIAASAPVQSVVVTTLPIAADLVGRFPAARWIYYCVDDFSAWPGLDGRTMRQMEVELLSKVDLAVAVSEHLQEHLAKLGKTARLLTHGVDLDFWRRQPSTIEVPAWVEDLQKLSRPFVSYWGVIDRRLDVSFLRKLAEELREGTILLVGPQENPEPELLQIPRLQLLPALPFAELPHLAAISAAFIAPYADLRVTRAMQPLKLKEYLATGKPVVVRKLPATASWGDCADAVDTAEAFAKAVCERLARGVPPEQKAARMRLEAEGWEVKSQTFERWIDGGA